MPANLDHQQTKKLALLNLPSLLASIGSQNCPIKNYLSVRADAAAQDGDDLFHRRPALAPAIAH